MANKTEPTTRKKHKFIFYLWYILKKVYGLNPILSIAFFAFALISSFLPQVESFTLGKMIDAAVKTITPSTTSAANVQSFMFILIVASAILLTDKFIYDINNFVIQLFALRNQNTRDLIGFQATLKAKVHYFEDPDFVRLKSKVDGNGFKISQIIMSLTTVITSFISAGVIIAIFSAYDWRIVLMAIVSLILPIVINLKFGKQVWGIWDSMSEEKVIYSKYRNYLFMDSPSHFTEMKVFGYGKYLLNTALHLNKIFVDKLEVNERKRLLFTMLSRLWEFAFTVAGFYYVFALLINGRVSVGQFFFVVTLFQSMRSIVSYAFEQLTTVLSDGAFFETFYDYLNFVPRVQVPNGTKNIDVTNGVEIEFKDVSFKYPGTEKMVLKDVSFKIPANKDIALVGKNGAGKTTLIKLMLRAYDPTKGSILINGQNIKELELDEYYKRIGILSQDFMTFEFKAWENIFIGDVDKPMTMINIVEAAKKAKADEFIQNYPKQYETYLARDITDGTNPSGGQWQRLAIARVFYRDPKLIILDEPTSAIDALAEEQIFTNIREFAKEKTIVMVSHRFATVKKANFIYVIDDGQIVEQGTHEELADRTGTLYSRMFHSQND